MYGRFLAVMLGQLPRRAANSRKTIAGVAEYLQRTAESKSSGSQQKDDGAGGEGEAATGNQQAAEQFFSSGKRQMRSPLSLKSPK